MAIQARWEPIVPLTLKFVTDVGRVKYVRACYQRLFEWDGKRAEAIECFERNKPNMHNFTIQFILSLLNNKNKAGAPNGKAIISNGQLTDDVDGENKNGNGKMMMNGKNHEIENSEMPILTAAI